MHNSSKIVLFDIDYTVFNTDVYLLSLRNRFATFLQISQKEAGLLVKESIAETRRLKNHFDPDTFLTEVGKRTQRPYDLQLFTEIFWDKEIYANAVYDEVEEVISLLRDKNITVGILSTGNEQHQRQKIEIVAELLAQEHIHIFIDKLQEMIVIAERYKNRTLYIIDDLQTVLSAAKRSHTDVVTIQVNKQKHFEVSDSHDTIKPDFTVSNLREIIPIVLQT